MTSPLGRLMRKLEAIERVPLQVNGCVASIAGQALELAGLRAPIGSVVALERAGAEPALAEVVGFRGETCIAVPLSEALGVEPGARSMLMGHGRGRPRPSACLGRIIDGLARPIDAGPLLELVPRSAELSLSLLERRPIREPLDVGVRAVNALHTIGRGSRIGIFSGPGVGKSTLLGQFARFTEADAIVVGLVGERRREVREFIDAELGDALARSTVVVSTSDDPPAMRRRAGSLASRLALDLAAEGRDVLLLMDSLSRICSAQREIGLAAGEPPATRGYPPSVWGLLPTLLERAGTLPGAGSVTGIYTVLVEGDDLEEPVADAARSLLDGHIVLSRRVAEAGRFPAIDSLASLSRVMSAVVSEEHLSDARSARSLLSTFADVEDLVRIGGYVSGSDARADRAIAAEPRLASFASQGRDERSSFDEAVSGLRQALGNAS